MVEEKDKPVFIFWAGIGILIAVGAYLISKWRDKQNSLALKLYEVVR